MSFLPKNGYRGYLANQARDLLNLPTPRNTRFDSIYKGVNAIFKVMKDALLRGEEIRIPGFGIFRVVTKPAKNGWHQYFFSKKNRVLEFSKPRKYAKFFPSKYLTRYINTEKVA